MDIFKSSLTLAIILLCCMKGSECNLESKRLYDDLLSNYNRLIRPVANNSEKLTVYLRLKLSQLIEVNMKNQFVTTNLWVVQKWEDYKLRWDPAEYGGTEQLYVPSEHIWLPDIVLYNKQYLDCVNETLSETNTLKLQASSNYNIVRYYVFR